MHQKFYNPAVQMLKGGKESSFIVSTEVSPSHHRSI